MRQLIARVDEDLHGKLKAQAKAEGRSLNALVTELLRTGISRNKTEARVRARLRTGELRVVPDSTRRAPSREAAIRATRGAGRAASRALKADRQAR
ncbi:MAG: toxin-antitoxin system HicB family antitoxin [Actinomycetota bacterium]